jgi:hypothetical protein
MSMFVYTLVSLVPAPLRPVTRYIAQGHDGLTANWATPLNGHTIIQAEEREEALRLLRDHPYLFWHGMYAGWGRRIAFSNDARLG